MAESDRHYSACEALFKRDFFTVSDGADTVCSSRLLELIQFSLCRSPTDREAQLIRRAFPAGTAVSYECWRGFVYGEPLKGWLHKRGPTNQFKWERYWCVLGPQSLDWYQDETEREKVGSAPLCHPIRNIISSAADNIFEIGTGWPNSTSHYLQADSAEQLRVWLGAVRSRGVVHFVAAEADEPCSVGWDPATERPLSCDGEGTEQQITHSCPTPQKVIWVSDVEGHLSYFCEFVELTEGIEFKLQLQSDKRLTAEELELDLAPETHFVFGGDTGDKGPGTLRFLQTMVRFKRKYPDRVHLLQGNRDVNKIRWTAELAVSEVTPERAKSTPQAFWLPQKNEGELNGYWQYITNLAREQESLSDGDDPVDLTEEKIMAQNSASNKMLYLQSEMGSVGDFEFRRLELSLLREVDQGLITDNDVLVSYLESLQPNGWLYEYLLCSQLVVLLGTSLYVHSQIIGNTYTSVNQLPSNTEWSVQVVPGKPEPVEDLVEWAKQLNQWGRAQLNHWQQQPTWAQPPTHSTYEGWSGRGGADLIAYGTPGTRVATVVYARYLDTNSMPLQYPPKLVKYLRDQGVKYVVIGHTPHGNAPTVIQHEGLLVIMGDTSFSHFNSNAAYQGDNRGKAVCTICVEDTKCTVKGSTEKAYQLEYSVSACSPAGDGVDNSIGWMRQPAMLDQCDTDQKRFFVKAKLPGAANSTAVAAEPTKFILSSIQGYRYDYALVDEEGLLEVMTGGSMDPTETLTGRSGAGEHVIGHSVGGDEGKQLVEDIFRDSTSRRLTRGELFKAFTVPEINQTLRAVFPGMGLQHLAAIKGDGSISADSFLHACEKAMLGKEKLQWGGIYFPAVVPTKIEMCANSWFLGFPYTLGPFSFTPTSQIRPTHLKYSRIELEDWSSLGRACSLQAKAFQGAALEQILAVMPGDIGSQNLSDSRTACTGQLSAVHRVTVPASEREDCGIPSGAVYYAWSYPYPAVMWVIQALKIDPKDDPDIAFLTVGGFVYMDEKYEPVQMNATKIADGPPKSNVTNQSTEDDPTNGLSMTFGQCRELPKKWVDKLLQQPDLASVTLLNLIAQKATHFSWVAPDQHLEEDGPELFGDQGGFAYLGLGLQKLGSADMSSLVHTKAASKKLLSPTAENV